MPASIQRPFASMRRRGRSVWAWLARLGCVVLLSACSGGSGSSGFDVSAENAAIDTALQTNNCTMNDGLTICRSGSEAPTPSPSASPSASATPTNAPPQITATARPPATATGTPAPPTTASPTPTFHLADTPTRTVTSRPTETPTATPIPSPQVLTDQSVATVVDCTASAPTAPCLFELTFEPQGFSPATSYAVAYRMRNPDSDWHIVTPTGFSATIPLDPGAQYQFAVLVFVGGDGRTAPVVDALGQTDANFAFVTPVLTAEEVAP